MLKDLLRIKKGLDYSKTIPLVSKMVTVRSVVAVAATNNWPVFQMDVHNDFLNSNSVEEVYMVIPSGF